ncbi:MAG TPA: nucleotidyltransferase family protein [Polyangiaceae bacterium]
MPQRVAPLCPPEVPLDRDIRWVLLAAFASGLAKQEQPASAERASQLIRRLGLVQQVASRRSVEELTSVLGEPSAKALLRVAAQSSMRSLAVTQSRNAVLKATSRAQIDIALLKGAALEVLGVIEPGERYYTDVDVLVELAEREKLTAILLDEGFAVEHRKAHANDVVVVRSAKTDIGVELHTRIQGIRLATGLSPDMSALRAAGLLVPRGVGMLAQSPKGSASPNDSVGLLLPTLPILGAQLVVQGWYLFHFVPNAPRHKTPVRLLVDLSLLRVHEDVDLADAIFGYVEHLVPEEEFRGLVALAHALTRGHLQQLERNAQCVLFHIIAASIDERYRSSLMLERQQYAVSGEGLGGWTRRQLSRLILPSPTEVRSLIAQGSARNPIEARARIAWRLVDRGIRGSWASIVRRKS